MRNIRLTVIPELTVVAWSGTLHTPTLWQTVTWTVLCYMRALWRTRLNVRKWSSIALFQLITASCQWRSSHLVLWVRRLPPSSVTSNTRSQLWQLSQSRCVLNVCRLSETTTKRWVFNIVRKRDVERSDTGEFDVDTNTNNVISTAPFTPGVTNGALQLLVGLYHEYALLKR